MARLHALGVRPVAIAGSSAGAITAGLYAAGLGQEAIRDAVLSPRLYLSFAKGTRWVWHQFVRARAFVAMPGHVVHLAVLAPGQPVLQVLLVFRERDAGDAGLLEAEFPAPGLDAFGQGVEVVHGRKYRIPA